MPIILRLLPYLYCVFFICRNGAIIPHSPSLSSFGLILWVSLFYSRILISSLIDRLLGSTGLWKSWVAITLVTPLSRPEDIQMYYLSNRLAFKCLFNLCKYGQLDMWREHVSVLWILFHQYLMESHPRDGAVSHPHHFSNRTIPVLKDSICMDKTQPGKPFFYIMNIIFTIRSKICVQ